MFGTGYTRSVIPLTIVFTHFVPISSIILGMTSPWPLFPTMHQQWITEHPHLEYVHEVYTYHVVQQDDIRTLSILKLRGTTPIFPRLVNTIDPTAIITEILPSKYEYKYIVLPKTVKGARHPAIILTLSCRGLMSQSLLILFASFTSNSGD